MTRSAGTSGLTLAGSPPRSAIASRMTARSTTAGTPVKSWRITRDGMNGISASAGAPGGPAASGSTSPARRSPPPAGRGGGAGAPRRERLDILGADDPAAGVTEDVLEQDP